MSFIGAGRGGATITKETITNQSTFNLIAGVALRRILLRVLMLAVVTFTVVLIGRWAGPLMILCAALAKMRIDLSLSTLRFSVSWSRIPDTHDEQRIAKHKRTQHYITVVFLSGITLSLAAWRGYWWPLWFQVGNGQLWVAHKNGSFALGAWAVFLRFALIAFLPWLLWRPLRAADWALAMENAMPKARETVFAPADPAGITLPDGTTMQAAKRGSKKEEPGERPTSEPNAPRY